MGTTEQDLQTGAIDYVQLRKQALASEQEPQPVLVGDDIDYQALRQRALAADEAPAPTEEALAGGVSNVVNEYVAPVVQDLSKHLSKSDLDVEQSFALAQALAGQRDVDQVLAEYKVKAKDKGLTKPDLTPFGIVLGPAAGVVGQYKTMLKAGTVGGILGAPLGLLGSGALASAAVFTSQAVSSAGDMYGTFIKEGMPDEQARILAAMGGLVLGKLGMSSWNMMGKTAQKAFISAVTGTGKATFKEGVKGYVGFIGAQGLLAGGGKLTEQALGTIGKAAGNHQIPTPHDVAKGIFDLLAATVVGAGTGAVVGPAIHATGAITGRLFNAALKFKQQPTQDNAAELIDATLHPNESKPLAARISYNEPAPIALPEKTSQARFSEKKQTVKAEHVEATKRLENADKQIEALKGEVKQVEQDYDAYIEIYDKQLKEAQAEQKPGDQKKLEDLKFSLQTAQSDLKVAKKDLSEATKKSQVNKLNGRIAKIQEKITSTEKEIQAVQDPYEREKVYNTRRLDLVKQKKAAADEVKFKLQLTQEEKKAAIEAEHDTGIKYREMQKADRKIAATRLAGALKAAAPLGSGLSAESKVRGENVQKVLDYFRLFATDENALKQHEDDFYRAVATGEPTDEQRIAHEVATQVGKLNEKSPEELNTLARTIEGITEEGKANRAIEVAGATAAQVKLNGEVFEGVQGALGGQKAPVEDVGNPHADERSQRTVVSRAGDFVRQYGNPFFNWEGKWDIGLQDMPPEKRKPLIAKLSWSQPVKKYLAAKRAYADTYWNYLKEETNNAHPGGTWNLLKALAEGAVKSKTVYYIDADGKDAKVKMTYLKMVHTLMMMEDPTLHRGLVEGNKYTLGKGQRVGNQSIVKTTEKAINEALPPEYQGIKRASQKLLGKTELGGYFADAFQKDTGLELQLNDNYSGPAQRVAHQGETNTKQWELELNEYRPASNKAAKPGSAIARVDSNKPLKSKNAFVMVMTHIENITNYAEKREHSKVVAGVLADPAVKGALDVKFPGLHAQLVANNHDIVHGVNERVTAMQQISDHIIRGVVVDNLGLKPDQPLKQLSGVINGLLEMPTGEFAAGVSEFWTDPVGNSKTLLASPSIRGRFGGYTDVASGVAGERSRGVFDLTVETGRELSLAPMKLGDLGASMQTGYAVYRWKMKQPGATHEQALHAAEEVIERTQATGRIDLLSDAGRKWYLKPLFILQQPTLMQFQYETTAWRDALNHPTAKNYLGAAKTSFVLGVSNFAFKAAGAAYQQYLASNGWGKQEDADNAMWRAYRGLLLREDMPVVGGLIDAQILKAQKAAGANTTEQPRAEGLVPFTLQETSDNTLRFHSAFDKAVENGSITWEEFWDLNYKFARSAYNRVILQAPLSGPTKIGKGANEGNEDTAIEIELGDGE